MSKPVPAENFKKYSQCMTNAGWQDKLVYQPAERFWLFQGIESGIYLLLAAFLLVLIFWWTKHKIA